MIVSDLSASEFDGYTSQYIRKVPLGEFKDLLEASKKQVVSFFESIPEEKLAYRYAPGKWTVKEILQHLIDTERVFAYRALRFARMDRTPLPGFEVDDFVEASYANERIMKDLIEEYSVVRAGTQFLFDSLQAKMLKNIGVASGSDLSVRAAGFKLIGHEMHHCEVIEARYL